MVQGNLGLENLSISLSRSIARQKKASFALGFFLCTYGENVPDGLDLERQSDVDHFTLKETHDFVHFN